MSCFDVEPDFGFVVVEHVDCVASGEDGAAEWGGEGEKCCWRFDFGVWCLA